MSFGLARVAPEKAVFRPALPVSSLPGVNGTHMTMTYKEQLLHPFWQRKRLQRLEASEWMCDHCSAQENTLHVHHKRYVKGRMAWEYENDELAVLCNKCHLDEHALDDLLKEMLSASSMWTTLGSVVPLVGGYLSANYAIGRELSDKAKAVSHPTFLMGTLASVAALCSAEKLAVFVRDVYASFPHGSIEIDPAIQSLLVDLDEQVQLQKEARKANDA